jgi:general secretion pathway protein L
MPHSLLIRLFAGGATEWLAQGRDGAVLQGPVSGLPQVAADEVVLLLPAEDVLLLAAPRIGRSRAQTAQALPFAIEEQLAAPVEAQHVAFDDRGSGDSVAVAVIARQRLDAALAALQAAGITVERAYAESQLLPLSDGMATAWIDGDRTLLRWTTSGALVTSTAHLADIIALLRDSDVGARPWRIFSDDAGAVPATLGSTAEPVGTPLRWLASRLAQVDGPQLLQGDYRPARRRSESRGLWRWAAGLAAAALLFVLLQAGVERAQLQALVAERQAEMEQLLRHALPGVQRVVDPVAQLRIELERSAGPQLQGALPLLAHVAPVLAGSGRYTLEGIDYRGGALELVVIAPDIAALDALRERIAALPMQVELPSAVPGSRGVEGRLRIRGAGA